MTLFNKFCYVYEHLGVADQSPSAALTYSLCSLHWPVLAPPFDLSSVGFIIAFRLVNQLPVLVNQTSVNIVLVPPTLHCLPVSRL